MGGSRPAPGRSVDDVLAHFGVKGMKWGVRSASPGGGMPSADAKSAANIKSKIKRGNTKALSNKELQELVTRMNLEQQYSTMTAKSKKQRLEGAKFAIDTLTELGKNPVVKAYASAAAKQVVAFVLKR